MRGTLASSLTRRTWWWVFALFIAAPAVALTWLGFRSIRAAEIERDQRLREEQAGVARLVDASLASAFDRTITDVKAAGHLDDAVAFIVEDTGVIAFPADRVYFGPFGVTPSSLPALHTPSSITALIGQAQRAEAQGRHVEARALYERIRADRDLAAWANLKLAMVAVDSGDRSRLSAVADSRLATSNARTPAGIPLAVAAASYAGIRERTRARTLSAARCRNARGASRRPMVAPRRPEARVRYRTPERRFADSGETRGKRRRRRIRASSGRGHLDVLLRKAAAERGSATTSRAALVKTDSGSVLLVWAATSAEGSVDAVWRSAFRCAGSPRCLRRSLGPLECQRTTSTRPFGMIRARSIWGDLGRRSGLAIRRSRVGERLAARVHGPVGAGQRTPHELRRWCFCRL